MLWTDFKRADGNSTYCSTKCQHSPTCFDFFFSDFGCFFIRGNLTKPAASGPPPSAVHRKLSGHLFGCRDTGTGQGECPRTDLSEGRLRFRGVKPDWRGRAATLSFSLVLEVRGFGVQFDWKWHEAAFLCRLGSRSSSRRPAPSSCTVASWVAVVTTGVSCALYTRGME